MEIVVNDTNILIDLYNAVSDLILRLIYCKKHISPIRGKTGIRTLEPFLTTTRFPDVPLQPLEHLSNRAATETGLSAGANIRIKSLKFQLYFRSS